MSGQTSEEKTLPASQKKLNDARKKGQVSSSPDFVGAVALLFTLGGLAALAGPALDQLQQVVILALGTQDLSLPDALGRLVPAIQAMVLRVILPVLVLATLGGVAASVIVQKGFVFALDPIKPNFGKLDPVKGLGNMFKKKGMIELVKSAAKAVFLGATFTIVILNSLDSLVHVPNCGYTCLLGALVRLGTTIAVLALLFLLVIGALDIRLQRSLFLDEMKMTKTEVKKESKEQQGTPELRAARNRLRKEDQAEGPVSVKDSSLIVFGPGTLVGLRYDAKKVPLPVVVLKARAERAGSLLVEAHACDKPIVEDPILADMLLSEVGVGRPVASSHFVRVVQALRATGLA